MKNAIAGWEIGAHYGLGGRTAGVRPGWEFRIMGVKPGGTARSSVIIAEMKEFATFEASTQRYIRRSIDVASDADAVLDKWARDAVEVASIRAQRAIYERLDHVRGVLPEASGPVDAEPMIAPLVVMAAFDLGQGRLPSFSSFRFLYERLLGGRSRPWLPTAFMAAAGMPHLHPTLRGTLLRSISESAATASGWNAREAGFVPSWVEKVQAA